MGSTAAQSSDFGINSFSQKLIKDKYQQIARMSAATQIERPYQKNMQKQLLCRQIRDRLRKEFYLMYRNAEMAYAALDYTGLGHITEDAFMNCQIISQRLPFTVDQIRMFFEDYNLFNKECPGLNFDTFKKNFFPHLYLVQDPADDEADRDAEKDRNDIKKHGDKYNLIVEKRVQKLEAKLKEKFSNCFESVRKAFLALDTDFDGFITVEDILKYFGTDTDLNYNELQKLMNDKDSKKKGRINYQDFSKWLGNTIHMPQGFYFRHDSILNPNYNQQLERQEKTMKNADRKEVTKILLGTDIEYKILEKIKFQWKTVRKAFQDMNISKTGKISKEEFKYYLQFWGIIITEDQFNSIFNKFDIDQDGQLSYKEFQQSIGAEMFPQEGLYFRQDKAQQCNVNTCKQTECWQPTKNKLNFCDVHQKMHQGLAIQNFSKLFKQFGNRWPQFIDELKRASDRDDQSQISFNTFINLTREYGGTLDKHEFNEILMAFPGKEGGVRGVRIDIGRIYDQKYFQILQKVYDKMDFAITGGEDEPVDQIGYIGKTLHQREKLGPLKDISNGEFIYVIFKNNKLKEIMFDISQIDNHTGVVTKNEMDDILKLHYPEKLKDKNLMPIISLFSSIQNKILIDHKKMRDWILKGLAKIELKIEKKRLINNKDRRIQGGQVTAMDMISHQNNSILKQINNLERKLNLNQEKLERRSESQHKSYMPQTNLDQYHQIQNQSVNDDQLQSNRKQRPVSSFKAYDSRKSEASNNLVSLQMNNQQAETEPKIQMDGQKIHKNSKIHNKNQAQLFSMNNNGAQQAMRRPKSSIGGGSTTGLNKNRLNLLDSQISSYVDKDTSEYVNIKDLIKNDKDYIDRRKNITSSRNHHMSNTVQQQGIKFSNNHNYNNSTQEWQTGQTQKFKYTSSSSNHGLDQQHQNSKLVANASYQNQTRRPYSSMHHMQQSNRSGENSQIEFPSGTLDRHQGRMMQIDRSLAALGRKASLGNVLGRAHVDTEDTITRSRRNMVRTNSESQLIQNAYSKSKLIPTSDQMMMKLVNFGQEKDIEKKFNKRQKSTKSKLEYLQGLDEMGLNYYEQQQQMASKTPQVRTDPINEIYSDEDQNNSNYYTPIDTNHQNGKYIDQDNSDFKNKSGFAKDQNLRRSESQVRNSYREQSNDSHNLQKMNLIKKRNTSIEVQLPLSSQASLERRLQHNYKIRKILSSQNLSYLSPGAQRLSVSVCQQDNQSLKDHTPKVQISATDKQMICIKLAYEWKNIFRAILRENAKTMQNKVLGSSDFVIARNFDAICQRFGVTLSKEQINKIQKLFAANSIHKNQVGESAQGSIKGVINFVALSQVLGLHKDSYNYMGQHSLSNERSRSIFRLQRTQQSIEPVEEESIQVGQNFSDYDYKKEVNVASRQGRGARRSIQRGSALMAEDWDMKNGKFSNKKKIDFDQNEIKIRKPSFTSLEDRANKIYKLKKLKKHLGSQGQLINKQQAQRDFQRRNYIHDKEKLALLTAVTEEEFAKYDKDSRRKDQNKYSQRRQNQIVSTTSSTSPHILDASKQTHGFRSDNKKISLPAGGCGY